MGKKRAYELLYVVLEAYDLLQNRYFGLSEIDDMMMMVDVEESLESSRKRKLAAEESSDLLPLSKHLCLEQQQASLPESSCPSSDIESGECSYAVEDTKTSDETSKDSCYSTGSSSWSCGYAASVGLDQYCSKVNDEIQEYVEDLEFICPEFAVEDLQALIGCEDSNLEGSSYTLSSARWSVSNQDSEEATKKPTIDKEFEEYFSTLMM